MPQWSTIRPQLWRGFPCILPAKFVHHTVPPLCSPPSKIWDAMKACATTTSKSSPTSNSAIHGGQLHRSYSPGVAHIHTCVWTRRTHKRTDPMCTHLTNWPSLPARRLRNGEICPSPSPRRSRQGFPPLCLRFVNICCVCQWVVLKAGGCRLCQMGGEPGGCQG